MKYNDHISRKFQQRDLDKSQSHRQKRRSQENYYNRYKKTSLKKYLTVQNPIYFSLNSIEKFELIECYEQSNVWGNFDNEELIIPGFDGTFDEYLKELLNMNNFTMMSYQLRLRERGLTSLLKN